MLGGTQLIRGDHVVVDTPFVRYVRRRAGHRARDLMSYYMPDRRRYVVGVWSSRLAGTVVEIMAYSSGERLTDEHVLQILFNLDNDRRVRGLKRWARQQLTDHRAQHRFWYETEQQRREHREFAIRQAGPMIDPGDPRWLAAI